MRSFFACLLLASAQVFAQPYPTKPVRIVVPASPGGASDLIARLKPEAPWYGYSLGEWPDELERAAELAVKGDYFETGKLLAERRRKDVGMNTEVRDLSRKQESDE